MKIRIILWVLLISLLIVDMSEAVEEVEPNDSLDRPQTVLPGIINGTVNESDGDVFKVEIPQDNVMFFSLKKTNTGSGSIEMDLFDSYRRRLIPGSTLIWDDSELTISGEMGRGYLTSSDSPETVFLSVSGSGSYELEVLFNDTEDPNDPPGTEGDAVIVEIGELRSGRVFELEYGFLGYEDVDLYEIPVDEEGYVNVRITKTDSSEGTIHARLDQYLHGWESEVELDHQGETGNLEEYASIYADEDESVYLLIWGEGEYEIRVSFDDQYPDEELLMGIILGVMAFYMIILMSPFLVVIVIIIVVVVVIVKTSKPKGEEARRRSKRKLPEKARKPPKS